MKNGASRNKEEKVFFVFLLLPLCYSSDMLVVNYRLMDGLTRVLV